MCLGFKFEMNVQKRHPETAVMHQQCISNAAAMQQQWSSNAAAMQQKCTRRVTINNAYNKNTNIDNNHYK